MTWPFPSQQPAVVATSKSIFEEMCRYEREKCIRELNEFADTMKEREEDPSVVYACIDYLIIKSKV